MDELFNFLELFNICMLLLQVKDLETKTIRATGEEVFISTYQNQRRHIKNFSYLMARFSKRTNTFKRRNPIQQFPGFRHFLET